MKVYTKVLHRAVVLEMGDRGQFRVKIPSLGYRSLYHYDLDTARLLARVHICAQIRRHQAPLFLFLTQDF